MDRSTATILFISHASADAQLVMAVVDLFEKAFHLSPGEIRCTSLDGYGLTGGVDTDQQLREEITSATVFVGIATPTSYRSAYVLLELGARWGVAMPLTIAFGAGFDPRNLPGPIGRLNAVDLTRAGQVFQLLNDLGLLLKRPVTPAAGLYAAVERLTAEAQRTPNAWQPSSAQAMPDLQRSSGDGLVVSGEELTVLKLFVEFKDQHSPDDVTARLRISRQKADDYLDRLKGMRFLSSHGDSSGNTSVFFITAEGRDFLNRQTRRGR